MANKGPTATAIFTITDKDGNVFTRTVDPDNFESVTNIANSLESDFTETTGTPSTGRQSPTRSASSEATTTQTQATSAPSTLQTSSIPTQTPASAAPESSASSVASGSDGENPSATSSHSCNSISCNAGLQAAIAVPVVVGTLLIFALAFLCIRRRKRRQESTAGSLSEKRQRKPKKWSRHLRIFSFDAELLMGGRFSSSNSLRSRETGSQHSATRAGHAASPSIHSVDEEVAPPYRDAVSHAQPPSTVPMATGLASSTSEPFPRPDSVATAPPPYPSAGGLSTIAAGGATAAAATNISRATSRASSTAHTPVSTRSLNDPFRNEAMSPVSPVHGDTDTSPFVDPPEHGTERSPISPSTSMMFRRRAGDDYEDAQSTISSVAEVASVREAQVGRTLSGRHARRV